MARELRRLQLALVEEEIERRRFALNRRLLRDSSNPFDVGDDEFIKYFRVPKVVARYIIAELEPVLARRRRSGLAVHTKVLVTLRFLAEGGYQRGVGQDRLLQQWIAFPKTPQEWTEIGERFRPIVQFPGVVGAIDCTHIAIVTPIVNEEGYRNHKGFHSFNVQMICDDQTRILNIRMYPGSVHDQFIWSYSSVKRVLKEAHERRVGLFHLIGDSGYALEPWLLTPLPQAPEGTPEYRYTLAHCRARSVVERLFGVLKGRWRCLLKDRVLHYKPMQASTIIIACAVLHNIMVHYRVPLPEVGMYEGANMHHEGVEYLGDRLQVARRIQGNIIQQYF